MPPTADPSTPARLLGAHMPTSGGLKNSLTSGKAIGCTAVQLFTGNPRQWKHNPLPEETASEFRRTQTETGIAFTIAHDSYLINLAAPDGEILEKSRAAFHAELERANALGIPWVVTHMGAHMDSAEDAALDLLAESVAKALRETEGMQAGIALETTAGQGTGLGWRFEQIARVLDDVGDHPRLGVCFDTCHVFVAGYDLRDSEAYDKTMDEFGARIGFERLKAIHANDAKKPLGSRVDRHEHIGDGEIGSEGFRLLLNDPRLREIPVILETPDADTMHAVNLQRLQALAGGA